MLNKNRSHLFIALFIGLFAFSSSSLGQKLRLELKYAAADTQRIVTETTMKTKNMDMRTILALRFTVDSVTPAGIASFSVKPVRIFSHTTMDGEKEDYDSDKGSIADMHKSFFYSTMGLRLNKQGKIITPLFYKDTKQSATAMFDIQRIQLVFPARELSIGDSWKDEYKNDLTSSVIKADYTLVSVNDTAIVISMKGQMIDGFGFSAPKKLTGEYQLDSISCQLLSAKIEAAMADDGAFLQRYYRE